MTDEKIEKIKDLFGGEYVPEIIEDNVIDFDSPIKGKYKCRIVSLQRREGTSKAGNEYDFYALKLQVVEDVQGDKSANRHLDKTYSNTVSEWQTDATEGRRKLMNDLFTANVNYDFNRDDKSTSDTILEEIAPQLIDQLVNVSAYPSKSKKQIVRIVKELKLNKTQQEETTESW